MKTFRKPVLIQTKKLNEFINITEKIQAVANESKLKDGMIFLNSLHNTGALILQEDDLTIHQDLINTLERIVPLKGRYEHDYEGNVNATAHLKTSLLGSFLTIPLENGKLKLGTWQNVFFVEFFEPREREVMATVIGD